MQGGAGPGSTGFCSGGGIWWFLWKELWFVALGRAFFVPLSKYVGFRTRNQSDEIFIVGLQ